MRLSDEEQARLSGVRAEKRGRLMYLVWEAR